MSEIIKIPLEQLDIGMVVVKFDKGGFSFPHYGRPFPDKVLKQYLQRNGVQFAFIKRSLEEAKTPPANDATDENDKMTNEYMSSLDVHKAKMMANTGSVDTVISPALNDLTEAINTHDKAKQVTKQILTDVKMGKVVDTDAARNIVSGLVEQCIKSPEAFVNISRLKDFDNYTFTHSVNVAVLAIAIGRRLGSSAQEMNNLGFAGLLHDIGKMKVPEEILNKPGKLTKKEFDIIKFHPQYGYDYLKDNGSVSDEILFTVRHHHEKSDGTGYPDGLVENDIPRFAKIISIADVYDAITSERSYHKSLVPSDALKIIFSWSGKHFNDSIVKFFISIMGIYPVGTMVVLNTNELAIILEPNKNDPMRPKVLVISNNKMEPITPAFFDLTSYNVSTRTPYKTIVSALDARDFSIDTNRVIEQYIKTNSKMKA